MIDIVYVLTNEVMPGYFKIGKTNSSLEQRVAELSRSTSVPLPVTVSYACTVKDTSKPEMAPAIYAKDLAITTGIISIGLVMDDISISRVRILPFMTKYTTSCLYLKGEHMMCRT